MNWRGWRRRRLLISLSGVAVVLILLYFIAPLAAEPFVRAKLQAMIAEQLDAKLSMGRMSYLPPYGVEVANARLTVADAAGKPVDLFAARSISLKLARLPLGSGPLLIQSIRVEKPSLHLVRTASGLLGEHARSPAKSTRPREKLSDLFQLRKLAINDGSIIYEDRADTPAAPMAWRHLHLDLNTEPKSSAEYGFDVRSGDRGITSASAKGSINIDDLLLRISSAQVGVTVDANAKSSALPGEVQRLIDESSLAGALTIKCAGLVPLEHPATAQLASTLELAGGTARLPGAAAPIKDIDAKLACLIKPGELEPAGGKPSKPVAWLSIERIGARGAGGMSANVLGGSIVANLASGAWGINNLNVLLDPGRDRASLPPSIARALDQARPAGKVALSVTGSGPLSATIASPGEVVCDVTVSPQDLTLHPAELPETLHDIGQFHFRLANGLATIEALRAAYGHDVLFIRQATLPVLSLPSVLDFKTLAGAITFDAKQPAKYPPPIAEALADARPRGPFFFDGSAKLDRGGANTHVDYRLHITTTRGGISTRRFHIPLYNVHADLFATPQAVDIAKFDADALTGTVSLTSHIDLKGALAYQGQLRLRRLDLNQLAQMIVKPGEQPMTVSGEINADASFSGRGIDYDAALNALQADGAAEVNHGDLFHIPVLSTVARQLHLSGAGTVGDAACNFKLADRIVHLSHAAVGAPAVGVQGSGDVGLDGSLNLDLIATGFNDWDRAIRGNDDNAVANVAASIAGIVQKGFDTVTRELIYQMHVDGNIKDPQMHMIAAPVLHQAQ